MRQIGTPLGESRAVHGLFDFIELSRTACADMQDLFAVSSLENKRSVTTDEFLSEIASRI